MRFRAGFRPEDYCAISLTFHFFDALERLLIAYIFLAFFHPPEYAFPPDEIELLAQFFLYFREAVQL